MQFTCGTLSFAFQLFNLFKESNLFLASYFIVSKWWLVLKWNKSLFLSPLGTSCTARAKLLLSGLNMTLFTAFHTCDVSHRVTWIARFQNGRRKKFWFCTIYRLFVHLGLFNLGGMYRDEKERRKSLPSVTP